jgi:hypothetical protein
MFLQWAENLLKNNPYPCQNGKDMGIVTPKSVTGCKNLRVKTATGLKGNRICHCEATDSEQISERMHHQAFSHSLWGA